MRLGFATWVSDAPTGGNIYNAHLVAGLRDLGVDLRVNRVGGTWPGGSADDRRRLAEILAGEDRWLVDGIVACDALEIIAPALASGKQITILLHMFLPDEVRRTAVERARYRTSEAAVLAAATGVVCTSRWSAAELVRRYGRSDAGVAVPGVDPAPLSAGSDPPRLLALGSLTSTKDQLTLVRGLARVRDLPWTARLVGSDRVEPDYTALVRAEVEAVGLGDRIMITGPRTGSALAAEYAAADLLVLTSRAESYGMVVVEALARGIPTVVVQGTGAVEAQAAGRDGEEGGAPWAGSGATVPPGDPKALAAVLQVWLTDAECRARSRSAARRQRPRLPPWADTARSVLAYLAR